MRMIPIHRSPGTVVAVFAVMHGLLHSCTLTVREDQRPDSPQNQRKERSWERKMRGPTIVMMMNDYFLYSMYYNSLCCRGTPSTPE
jgi:hypothetical protein